MAKRKANDRTKLLLSIIPWIVDNPGHKVWEIAKRFDLSEKELLDDLAVVQVIGLPPYTPDALVDIEIDEESGVSINLAEYFAKPLSLTPAQGLSVIAATDAYFGVADGNVHLRSAIEKLRTALGDSGASSVDVSLGEADQPTLEALMKCVDSQINAEIHYYSWGRNEMGERKITPIEVFSDKGHWYVSAYCFLAEGRRLFRVDRIGTVKPLDGESGDVQRSETSSGDLVAPRIKLHLNSRAMWVVDAYPYEALEVVNGNEAEVTFVVLSETWIQRLLLKLGGDAKVLEQEGINASELVSQMSERILGRYGESA